MNSRLVLAVSLLAVSQASAQTPSDFKEDAFYKITTVVGGQELALTWVIPGDPCPKAAQSNCASKSRVELQKFKNAPNQLWRPVKQGEKGNDYSVFSKHSDSDDHLTGVLLVSYPDNQFLEDKAYKAKHNRLTVGVNSPETVAMWQLTKEKDGKFRVTSLKGVHIKKPKDEPYPENWNEARSLEAVKGSDGTVELRHGKNADVPSQLWSITKAD